MTTEVAKLTLKVDTGQRVRRSFGRIALADLDRIAGQPGRLDLYLMAPLAGANEIPEAAIDLIKTVVGRAYRLHPNRLRSLIGSGNRTTRVLLELLDHRVRWMTTELATVRVGTFLTAPLAEPGSAQRRPVNVLLQYGPPVDDDEVVLRAIEHDINRWAAPTAKGKADSVADPEASDDHPRQRYILAHSLPAAAAIKYSSAPGKDARSWASRERKQDRLFGVWSSTTRTFVHPDFQFTSTGIVPRLPELLRALRTREGFDPAVGDRGGWARAYWLYQPDVRLSEQAIAAKTTDLTDIVAAAQVLKRYSDAGRTPAEMFASEPDLVLALARALPDAAA